MKTSPLLLLALASVLGLASSRDAVALTPTTPVGPPAFPPNTIGRPRPMSLVGPTRNVILQVDSDAIQVGIAGDQAPRLTIPAVVGVPRTAGAAVTFGADAIAKAAAVTLVHPIASGHVVDVARFGQVVRYALAKLAVLPQNARVLMNEPPLTPKQTREDLTKTMFDSVGVQGFYVGIDAVFALYASGRTTGIVFDGDYDVSHVTPIYEGYALPHAVMRMDLGQTKVAHELGTLLGARKVPVGDQADLFAMDERIDQIAPSATAIPTTAVPFRLSNGTTISVGRERFLAPEVYFEPQKIGLEQEGLDRLVFSAIMKCNVDIRKDLYNNVVLAGHGGHYPGLSARLTAALKALAPQAMTVKVIQPPEAERSVFIGESILASLSTFDEMWITRAEYQHAGAKIVHTKCM